MGMTVRGSIDPNWFTYHPTSYEGIGIGSLKPEYADDLKKAVQERTAQRRKEDIDASRRFDLNPDVRLSQEQMDYLKENYDPRDMTQEQYNAFVQDLQKFGALSAGESVLVDVTNQPQLIPLEYAATGGGVCAADAPGTTLKGCYGDALAWVKYRASFLNADPDTGKFYRSKQTLLFSKLENVLRRMEMSA